MECGLLSLGNSMKLSHPRGVLEPLAHKKSLPTYWHEASYFELLQDRITAERQNSSQEEIHCQSFSPSSRPFTAARANATSLQRTGVVQKHGYAVSAKGTGSRLALPKVQNALEDTTVAQSFPQNRSTVPRHDLQNA